MALMGVVIDPIGKLRELGGYYECPKGPDGQRLGPLVGYAGRDSQGRQFVGDIYANFAKAEQWPKIMDLWAEALIAQIVLKYRGPYEVDVCVGMPMGGIIFAASLARLGRSRVAFAEKKVTELATDKAREKSELFFGRHDIQSGDNVLLVEDVVNNFSTTGESVRLVEAQGAKVVGIAAILNRSGKAFYSWNGGEAIPLLCLVNADFPQYEQDDPGVIEDVRKKNVVWKPKKDWDQLAPYMQ